jgi:hypothetical protein
MVSRVVFLVGIKGHLNKIQQLADSRNGVVRKGAGFLPKSCATAQLWVFRGRLAHQPLPKTIARSFAAAFYVPRQLKYTGILLDPRSLKCLGKEMYSPLGASLHAMPTSNWRRISFIQTRIMLARVVARPGHYVPLKWSDPCVRCVTVAIVSP